MTFVRASATPPTIASTTAAGSSGSGSSGLLAGATRPGPDPVAPVAGRPFGDFAVEERTILESPKLRAARDAWVRMFASVPVTRGVPAGHWSPHLAGELCTQRLPLDQAGVGALEAARERHRATTAAIVLAAVASAYMEHLGSTDFACTVPVNARTRRDSDTVGCYINLMPLRVTWRRDADAAVRVERARKALVNLLMYRTVPGIAILADPRLSAAVSAAERTDAPIVFIQGAETTHVDVLGHRVVVDDGNGTREELGLTVRVVEGVAAHLAIDHDPGRFEPEIPRTLLRATRKWIDLLGTAGS
jgi:hypothetical protein